MFYANDEHGKKTAAWCAKRGGKYFCPICKAPVIIRNGLSNCAHFAHKAGTCPDLWSYDMSDWHKNMQMMFPESAREVVISNELGAHRADILIGKQVIEFQYSKISSQEFASRTRFFLDSGYNLAWVFNVNLQFSSHQLFFSSESNPQLMTWKNPPRMFQYAPQLHDNNPRYACWLNWGDDSEVFAKVVWSAKDDYDNPTFNRIVVSNRDLYLDCVNINDFFCSEKHYTNKRIIEIFKVKEGVLKSKYKYSIKYSGVKGKSKDSYVCPVTKKFGINIYTDCLNCDHCYMIAKKSLMDKNIYASYCCYPIAAKEKDEYGFSSTTPILTLPNNKTDAR